MNNLLKKGQGVVDGALDALASVRQDYRKINTACFIIIASVCLTTALIYTKTILVPLVISLFIYTMMAPVIRYMRTKMRMPQWLAAALASVAVTVFMGLLVLFLVDAVTNLVHVADTYREKLMIALNYVIDFLRAYDVPFADEPYDVRAIASLLNGEQITGLIRGLGGGALRIVSYSFLVLIFVFFFLAGGREGTTNTVIKQIQNKVSGYLFLHIIVSLVTGILTGIVLFSVGLEMALTFAVLAVLLNFIPSLGSIISVALPLPIAIIQFGFGPQFWVVLALPGIIQFVLGNIVEPKLLGTGLDLHPVAIIGALVFGALVWGVAGAFLAVPIASAAQIILNQLSPTRPLAEILAGRLPK